MEEERLLAVFRTFCPFQSNPPTKKPPPFQRGLFRFAFPGEGEGGRRASNNGLLLARHGRSLADQPPPLQRPTKAISARPSVRVRPSGDLLPLPKWGNLLLLRPFRPRLSLVPYKRLGCFH